MEVKFNAGDMCAIPEGCKATIKDGVIIFEKGFEDGDVLHSIINDLMLIYRESSSSEHFSSYFNTIHSNDFGWNIHSFRHATEEEQQLLFDKMKEQGLQWNAEEKRVEKIRWRARLDEDYYYFTPGGLVMIGTEYQDNHSEDVWEFGNHFRTEEQAKKAAEAVKEVLHKYHEEIGE